MNRSATAVHHRINKPQWSHAVILTVIRLESMKQFTLQFLGLAIATLAVLMAWRVDRTKLIQKIEDRDTEINAIEYQHAEQMEALRVATIAGELTSSAHIAARRRAATILGLTGETKHVPKLIEALSDDDKSVAMEAQSSLQKISAIQKNPANIASSNYPARQMSDWTKWYNDLDVNRTTTKLPATRKRRITIE